MQSVISSHIFGLPDAPLPSLSTLPDEILANICSRLSVDDAINLCSVTTRFVRVSQARIFQSVQIVYQSCSRSKYKLEELLAILQRRAELWSHIRKIVVIYDEDIAPIAQIREFVVSVLTNSFTIQVLKLRGDAQVNGLIQQTLKAINITAATGIQNLRTIELLSTPYNDVVVELYNAAVLLQSFSIHNYFDFARQEAYACSRKTLREHSKMETLDLNGLNSWVIATLINSCAPSLQSLQIHSWHRFRSNDQLDFPGLNTLPNLQDITIGDALEDKLVQAIFMQTLQLQSIAFTDTHPISAIIGTHSDKLRHLTSLTLTHVYQAEENESGEDDIVLDERGEEAAELADLMAADLFPSLQRITFYHYTSARLLLPALPASIRSVEFNLYHAPIYGVPVLELLAFLVPQHLGIGGMRIWIHMDGDISVSFAAELVALHKSLSLPNGIECILDINHESYCNPVMESSVLDEKWLEEFVGAD